VVFGKLFRAAGLRRDAMVVANKLWWEFWPEQSAAAELDGSLERMGFDHVDLIYASAPPQAMPVGELVAAVSGLLDAGKARARGVLNWPAGQIAEAASAARAAGIPAPCAAQLRYSLASAFPLASPSVASVLFGATSAGQLRANCAAPEVLDQMSEADLADLKAIGT
jgi:aryl-alcohol dehydrogenase-like predicted oxidoreductase